MFYYFCFSSFWHKNTNFFFLQGYKKEQNSAAFVLGVLPNRWQWRWKWVVVDIFSIIIFSLLVCGWYFDLSLNIIRYSWEFSSNLSSIMLKVPPAMFKMIVVNGTLSLSCQRVWPKIPNTSDVRIGCDIIPCCTSQKLVWNISNEITIGFIKTQVFIYYKKYQIKPRLRLTFHFAVLCNAIKNNTSVMTVNFSGCSLTWRGADTLAKVIKVL